MWGRVGVVAPAMLMVFVEVKYRFCPNLGVGAGDSVMGEWDGWRWGRVGVVAPAMVMVFAEVKYRFCPNLEWGRVVGSV